MSELPSLSIVDDDVLVRRSLKRVVGVTGYDVQVYASAESFLDSGNLDDCGCLILDVKMPGIGGLELQQHLQARNAALPIIFITSDIDETSKAQAMDAGAIDFLYKPFREEQLLDAIHKAFNADKVFHAD